MTLKNTNIPKYIMESDEYKCLQRAQQNARSSSIWRMHKRILAKKRKKLSQLIKKGDYDDKAVYKLNNEVYDEYMLLESLPESWELNAARKAVDDIIKNSECGIHKKSKAVEPVCMGDCSKCHQCH